MGEKGKVIPIQGHSLPRRKKRRLAVKPIHSSGRGGAKFSFPHLKETSFRKKKKRTTFSGTRGGKKGKRVRTAGETSVFTLDLA